ncbi:hypothetical protein CQ010_01385 [Arthrobacter sp. MYb211]|uniref:hypothetical protein n=1 Tax=unclassified Arthrobacter TaxID=235627 RepID=UPI000CFA8793|nr:MULTISPECIES: hypothetical protein [unclassified Arthrobacter]PRA13327.1 hypothetical protein CQ015_03640 [Arthrobacter sp. MYb221]PRC10524.1 hypothetical protein CQ010_01385 [Arthrobacter sp. MYb211]
MTEQPSHPVLRAEIITDILAAKQPQADQTVRLPLVDHVRVYRNGLCPPIIIDKPGRVTMQLVDGGRKLLLHLEQDPQAADPVTDDDELDEDIVTELAMDEAERVANGQRIVLRPLISRVISQYLTRKGS